MSALPISHRATTIRRPRLSRVLRGVVALSVAALAVLLLLQNYQVRALESKLLALWLSPLLPNGVSSSDTRFLITIPSGQLVAFDITQECTVLLLLMPVLGLSAFLLAFTKIGWLRAGLGLLVAAFSVLLVNQLRLAVIALTTQIWGIDFGYPLGHRFIGSVLALIGFALGFLIVLLIAFKPGKSRRRQGRAAISNNSGEQT
ncbi:exosortase/archaeosortase family protein [Psychromicrobium silvestre]|uniref:Exosortase/archaeosortase family protein n=1 Tax=Psychromicrobium silvestre TaxID=1645614 RepID=A0A7Y9LVU9_9MICC|nr:exosortase/archaeosortase family protein [Psychromicrobium silvestre]NYE96511.1 exosortase/archaeosortase family protein [Psychromicrobium silvestre]